MGIVVLTIIVVILLGTALGTWYRRLLYRRLASATLQKPEYDIDHNLSPAEFSMIVTGRTPARATAGELLWLQEREYIRLYKDKAGNVYAERLGLPVAGELSVLHVELLKELFYHVLPGAPAALAKVDLRGVIQYRTLESLLNKGWINPAKPYLRSTSIVPGRYYVNFIIAAIVALCGTWVGVRLVGHASATDTYFYSMSALTLVILAGIAWGFWIVFSGSFRDAAGIAIRTSEKYRTDYDKVYGVYEYMRIAGMDTMQPEYTTLDLRGLDPLYPYAVAVGLDKHIVKELQVF